MLFLRYLPGLAGVLIIMMMSTQLPAVGPYLVLLQIGLVGLLLIIYRTTALEIALRWWPVLLVPIVAVVSTLWSDAPMFSLRYGIQFLFTALTGVLLARLLTPKRFLSIFLVAMFLFCIACVIHGRQGVSEQGMVLIGLTGSKNQLGYAAQAMTMAGLVVLVMRDISASLRWIALLSLPFGAYLLLGANSATALMTMAAGAIALAAFGIGQRLAPGGRLAAILAGALVITPMAALTPEISSAINHFVFDTLDKSPTLTGRTRLWSRADDLISRRPLEGYGYQAAWLGESADSIALQRLTYQDGRSFHFHDQFRQTAVDTGLVGLTTLVLMLLAVAIAGLRQFLLSPTWATSFFFVFFMLLAARSFWDVILAPFSMHTMLFYAAATYAFWRPPEFAKASAPRFSLRRFGRAPRPASTGSA